MRLRIKYSAVLNTGDRIDGTTPVSFDKSVKKTDRLAGLKQLVGQVTDVYEHCQTGKGEGHIRLGEWRLDANKINAFMATPQRSTLFGWKDVE